MKLKKKQKIIIAILLLVFVLFICNGKGLFAAINRDYSTVDSVSDNYLDDAFNGSSLLGLLARLIYAVGQFLEWILGIIFKMLTGSTDFPWADKIVFNAVPLLDVNFINYDGQSFVGNPNVQGVLKNLYSTILGISVGFFGITVLITAIKLVISTIASEKAKYKQAIVDWLVGFIMLFCIHYFISFVFYLNEELVKVASKIVTDQLANIEKNGAQVQASDLTNQLIESMGNTKYNGTYKGKSGVKISTILKENTNIVQTYINLDSSDNSKGIHEMLMKKFNGIAWDKAVTDNNQKQMLATIISWAAESNVSVARLEEIRKYELYPVNAYLDATPIGLLKTYATFQAITEKNVKEIFNSQYSNLDGGDGNERFYYLKKDDIDELGNIKYNSTKVKENWNKLGGSTKFYVTGGFDDIGSVKGNWNRVVDFCSTITSLGANSNYNSLTYYWSDVLDDLIILKSASDTSTGKKMAGSGKKTRLIADLASYFRENASEKTFRDTNKTGLKSTGGIHIQNMIMYAILVAQSLILFISYIKRLFYVVILAMMSPIVVVFDFFQRFGK